MSDKLTCGTCRHIDVRNPKDVFCRAHPPTIMVMREKGKEGRLCIAV